MSVIVPLVGQESVVNIITAGGPYVMKLYRNNLTPVAATVLGDFTEANFSGYSDEVIIGWAAAFIGANNRAYSNALPSTFTHNGGPMANGIYGYYVLDNSGNLCWAERFANAPINITNNGESITVIAQFSGLSEF